METFDIAARESLFFMHIPKTAGMSLRSYLSGQYLANEVFPANTWQEAISLSAAPLSYRLVQGHFYYNMRAALRPGTKTITVLRDPLLRTLSALRHLRRDPHFHGDHALAKDLDLKQMLRNPYLMARQRNVQAGALCASASFNDVASLIRSNPAAEASELEDTATLELSLKRAEGVEFLGTIEHLWLLMRQLSESAGLHPASGLPLVNNAPDGQTSLAELDEDDIALLREYNDIDIALYDEVRELIEERESHRLMQTIVSKGIYRRMQGSFEFNLSEPIPGTGWYEPESEEERYWRWTGPAPRFTLDVLLPPRSRYIVTMHFQWSGSHDTRSLIVRANRRLLDVSLTREDETLIATIPLGPECYAKSDGYCRIVFDSGGVSMASGNDLRSLGMAVSQLSFARIE